MTQTTPFKLTAEDVVGAAWLYLRRGLTRPRVLVSWLVLWACFVAFLLFIDGGLPSRPDRWLLLLSISLSPLILVIGITIILTPITARRVFRQQRSLQGEMTLAWSDAGLHVQSEYGAFEMPWSHFVRWAEDDRSFLLFESDRLYRVVPKRVLTPDQQQGLRHFLGRIGA